MTAPCHSRPLPSHRSRYLTRQTLLVLCLAACVPVVVEAASYPADQAPPPTNKSTSPTRCAADYYVRHLPGLADDQGIKQFAGHITIDEATDSNLFFWLVLQRHNVDTETLIIWLNGGPGCSSMDGVFIESGPFRLEDLLGGAAPNLTVKVNPYSWHHQANVLFVDQPVGTGYSYAKSPLETHAEVAKHFIIFLDKFFRIFPQFSTNNLFIAGESYAGIYIPYIATSLLAQNKERTSKINLGGIAIGNGWFDPITQYRSYVSFASSRGLLADKYLDAAKENLKSCEAFYARNETAVWAKEPTACDQIMDSILDQSKRKNEGELCLNYYDVRLADPKCGIEWPSPLSHMKTYLNQPEVVSALNANGKRVDWKECNGEVTRGLQSETSISSHQLFPGILAEIPVLLFAGDQDLVCNHEGIEDIISRMTWNGATGFAKVDREMLWKIGPIGGATKLAGVYRMARNLTYVRVFNASHMVAWDKPAEVMDMMHRFVGIGDGMGVKNLIESKLENPSATPETSEPEADDQSTNPGWLLGAIPLVLVSLGFTSYFVSKRRDGRSFKRLFSREPRYEHTELDVWSADDFEARTQP